MMHFWSHRPPFLHLALFFAAYVLGCGFAQALAIVPGIAVSIWLPGGVFIATLILTSPHSWPWWVLEACLAEMFAQLVWFHSPLPAGFLIYVGNALAATLGAWLVNRACGRPVRLETLREVLAFVVLGAGIAPIASATVGSATFAWFGIKLQSFTSVWPLFWIGDATGILLVAPLALVVLQNWRSKTQLSAAQWMEASVLGLIFLGVAALSLSNYYLPFAYIIMPPLLWVAVRFEFKGVAIALSLLALLTVALTISGASQFVGDPESQRQKQIMLQLFLTISAFSALIVAAISRQHQRALLTLRDSERHLQQLVDAVPAMIWSATREGKPAYVNKRFTDVTGATLNDITATDGSPSLSLSDPGDWPAVKHAVAHSFETGAPLAIRYRQLRRDGSYRWTETRAEPLRDDSGDILQWYGVSVDIHDQVAAQEELHDRERELSVLVDMVPGHLWRLTPEGETIFFNKRLVDFVGMDLAELGQRGMSGLAGTVQILVHPDDATKLQETIGHSLATGKGYATRYRVRRADGVYRWMEGRGEPLRDQSGAIVQWYGISIDIDDEMRAQTALREREQELSQLVDIVPVHIRRLTPEGEPVFFNKRLIDFLGLDVTDLDKLGMGRLAMALQTLVHPDDVTNVRKTVSQSLAAGEPYAMKYRIRRADGAYRWVDGRAEPVRDESGAIVQWYSVSFDIDDQVHVQEALRERERALSQLVETLPAMIDCAAPDGEPIYRSRQLSEFLGYNLEELDGSGKSRLDGRLDAGVHPDDLDGLKEKYAHSLTTGEPYARRHRLRRFDGEYRWVETRAAPMRDVEGAIVQWNVICLDIDGEVRAQEELRLAQEKMARASQATSLAELSASIAHEVNQPLAAIVATSHACRRWLSADPPNLERAKITLDRIIRDANSASEVVSRIRSLFSQMGKTRSPADITEVIGEVCRLMADELALRSIEVETEFDRSLPPAFIDQIQMQQVLINLIRNAVDALDAIVDGTRLVRLRAVLDGDNAIRVEVRDLGAGMKEPEQAFEPFFTTKTDGMGMGLAICRSIIEAHDGRLWVTANEPRGTTLAFTLPIQVRDAA